MNTKRIKLRDLLIGLFNETITDAQFIELSQRLKTDPQARRFYIDFAMVNMGLRDFDRTSISVLPRDGSFSPMSDQLWQEMAETEMTAETVEITPITPSRKQQIVEKLVVQSPPRKINKYSLSAAIVSTAALLFMIFALKLSTPPQTGPVATMTHQINARWGQTETHYKSGESLLSGEYHLQSGFVGITFDYGAKVVIEGPADFNLANREQMLLYRGKVFAEVPSDAIGFRIDTPDTKVVDLGTRFGVEVRAGQDSFVQVYKGKVNLIPGRKGRSLTSEILTNHQARLIADAGHQVQSQPYHEHRFARRLYVDQAVAWRGAPVIEVYADQVRHQQEQPMTGATLNDMNHQIYGGLYSQLLYGESFQEHVDVDFLGLSKADRKKVYVVIDPEGRPEFWYWSGQGLGVSQQTIQLKDLKFVKGQTEYSYLKADIQKQLNHWANGNEQISRHWKKVQTQSAKGQFKLERQGQYHGLQSQRITFLRGTGEIGIDNAGLNRKGIQLQGGRTYEGVLRIRADKACQVCVSLLNQDGTIKLAEQEIDLPAAAGQYQKVEFSLVPRVSDDKGRFAVTLKSPGSVTLGYAFLQPGPWGRYKDLPVRKEMAGALLNQGLRFLRYDVLTSTYGHHKSPLRWKQMLKTRDERQPYWGWYDPYGSRGFGVLEFLDFCRAANIEPIVGLHENETAEDIADFIEYVNGAADTKWGRRRVADGRVQPYRLKYLQVGNGSPFVNDYVNQVRKFGQAVWSKSPQMTLIVSSNVATLKPEQLVVGADGNISHQLHDALRIARFAHQQNGSLWWNCHVDLSILNSHDNQMQHAMGLGLKQAIETLLPGYELQLAPLNGWSQTTYDYKSVLTYAKVLNELSRNEQAIATAGFGTVFGSIDNQLFDAGQDDRTHNDSQQQYIQAMVQIGKMMVEHWGPDVLVTDVSYDALSDLDIVARRSEDGRKIQLWVVNAKPYEVEASVRVNRFRPRLNAKVICLSGKPNEMTSSLQTATKHPVETVWNMTYQPKYTFEAYSFTLIELTEKNSQDVY